MPERLRELRDQRPRPRIPTTRVVSSLFLLFVTRMGSLHAFEQTGSRRFWIRWLGGPLASADTLGRVMETVNLDEFREVLYNLYQRFRRNKVFEGPRFRALILDGHETSSSYRRHCDGCLKRRVKTAAGERIQYYHRNVTAILLDGDFNFLLDVEEQRPGEDEVAAGVRLFGRVVSHVPRAFDVVLVDGLYARTTFIRRVRGQGKHLVAVLKENCPDLLADARGLFARIPPKKSRSGKVDRLLWDRAGFLFGDRNPLEVRIVHSHETTCVHHGDGTEEIQVADWYWVTTLPPEQYDTEHIVDLGHRRWTIENQGFNELVVHWNANHVYRHHPIAILAFWFLAFLAYNLYHAFVGRQIQPARRRRHTVLHWSKVMAADLYGDAPVEAWSPPP